jgi:antitoxin (DNA-binding transcriptional repressor) of toxin-antitoxin stability system
MDYRIAGRRIEIEPHSSLAEEVRMMGLDTRCYRALLAAVAARSNFSLANVATWSYIGIMKTVGVRELKNRLSEYIRHVRSGGELLVTDRGEVVAEIGPPGRSVIDGAVPQGLAALAKRGLATLGTPADGKLYPALPRRGRRRHRAAQLLDEERGDR